MATKKQPKAAAPTKDEDELRVQAVHDDDTIELYNGDTITRDELEARKQAKEDA